jgi:hypothetical protein
MWGSTSNKAEAGWDQISETGNLMIGKLPFPMDTSSVVRVRL